MTCVQRSTLLLLLLLLVVVVVVCGGSLARGNCMIVLRLVREGGALKIANFEKVRMVLREYISKTAVYIHFGPWSLRSLVTSVPGTEMDVQFGHRYS